MFVQWGECRLELAKGDITRQRVDAIVNAANADLAGGGGVDGAIHYEGGPELMNETDRRYPNGCPTGSAVATGAGRLPSKFVFHAVGPIWEGGQSGESELLASAYRRCLELAVAFDCNSIAFPALSTGAYGYPKDLAAEVSLNTAQEFLGIHNKPGLVRFVLFDEGSYGAYARVLESMTA